MLIEELDPIAFVERKFTLRGQPFKLRHTGREYLDDIYYSIAFKLPKTHQKFVMVKGRQVEMTTTMVNLVLYFVQTHKFFPVLYTFPAAEASRRFNSQRVEPMIRYRVDDTILQPLKGGAWNISQKQFSNGSELLIYGIAEDADNIRNITAECLVKDEYQDVDESSEGVVDEVLTHSESKLNLCLGTPKYSGTNYERVWNASTQHYYHLQCPTCKKYFPLLSLDDLVEGYIVKCPYCSTKEDKRNLIPSGKWVAKQPNAHNLGYHLSQLYVPYITREDIMNKIKDAEIKGADVKRYLQNEILGEFYSGLRQKPSWDSIKPAFKTDLPYDTFIPVTKPVYAGIDWGGFSSLHDNPENSFTVLTIGAWDDHLNLRVNYIEIIDEPDELKQVDRIYALLNKYHVKLAVADRGYGKIKNFALKEKLKGRFIMCKYLQGSSTTLFKIQDQDTLLVNRDYSLEELYSAMQRGKILIPDNVHTNWIKEHFYNFEVEVVSHGGQVFKHFTPVRNRLAKTDAVHSINYMRIAALFEDKKAAAASPLTSLDRNRAPLPVGGMYTGTLDKMHIELLKKKNIIIPQNPNRLPR